MVLVWLSFVLSFFFNATATTEIYTLSLHDVFRSVANSPSASVTLSPHFGQVPTTDTELGLR